VDHKSGHEFVHSIAIQQAFPSLNDDVANTQTKDGGGRRLGTFINDTIMTATITISFITNLTLFPGMSCLQGHLHNP
jgi:hypothetical protein